MELAPYPWSRDVNVQICDFSQLLLTGSDLSFQKQWGDVRGTCERDCGRVTGVYSSRFASLRTRLISGLVLNSAWKLCGEIQTIMNDCLEMHAGYACVFQKNNERRLILT